MNKTRKLVLLGDSAFAEVAYEYFTYDSEYEVVGFSVESAYLKRDSLFGLPVVAFEKIEERFPPGQVEFYAANVYTQLNHLRTRLYQAAKGKGYKAASYISRRAFIWPNVRFGEHCFIFEGNTLQPFVSIGNNVVLWSGNQVGHHTVIQDNCFISSHVVVSGFCNIGQYCFLGINANIRDGVHIGDRCIIGAGSLILNNVREKSVFIARETELYRLNSDQFERMRDISKRMRAET